MKDLQKLILETSNTLGTTWPLYSFVTSNPLSGYEHLPFEKAVLQASKIFHANTYPSVDMYQQALEREEIDLELLESLLKENDFSENPRFYLEKMNNAIALDTRRDCHQLDVMMSKWLSAFMDEGLAEWQMPNKEKGFYKSWKSLIAYDNSFGKAFTKKLPDDCLEALQNVLDANNITDYKNLFLQYMSSLPGWMGYIKHRLNTNSVWQQKYPINFPEYLAVRLILAQKLYGKVVIESRSSSSIQELKLKHLWLEAWERTFQKKLLKTLENSSNGEDKITHNQKDLDGQLIFCIDTRSEAIRRHIESQGAYETFGYAGFFGIAMDYQQYETDITTKSCPPIVGSPYLVTDHPTENNTSEQETFISQKNLSNSTQYILKSLKNMLPSSFGFVEGAGFFYGISLLLKTIIPQYFLKFESQKNVTYENFCEPKITYNHSEVNAGKEISLEEKAAILKSGFDILGWRNFASLVLFVGHGSHSTNNPFASSLDCGACAGSPGRHNARLLAKLANMPEVRKILKKQGINIPINTVFIGGEHNTTTDEILIFDAEVPKSHINELNKLKVNLKNAQKNASQERLMNSNDSIKLANKKATDWDETRPEWGLAKNAGFIVGPRAMTSELNLNGRCFLNSYDYRLDPEGIALEGIMCGPMVVTQWINNHYYFTTVDTDKFGAGSKITHNITGKFGVLQGNGGDLKMGLPLQSLNASDTKMYHQPLRLSVVIQAPLSNVETILRKQDHLKNLLDNSWIHLFIMNPETDNQIVQYKENFNWIPQAKFKLNDSSLKKDIKVLELT